MCDLALRPRDERAQGRNKLVDRVDNVQGSGVSRVWQVGQVPWAPLERGRHSTYLVLTHATRLTFLTV